MFSLLYVSTATAGLEAGEVDELARRAATSNQLLDVTGLLLWNGISFLQLLEGAEAAVRDVMARIAVYPRHRDLVYLRSGERPARECTGWSMRAMLVPLTGAGSATNFTGTLPQGMEPDTRVLFTSFASALRPPVEVLAPA